MPTLNRFPLLGLWAKEAARRIGYPATEAQALGHAYAVLYAIRANKRPKHETAEPSRTERRRLATDVVEFAGDKIDVVYDDKGRLQGLVGGDRPQTPRSYRVSVANKFPPGYLDRLSEAFQGVFKTIPPKQLDGRVVYDLYDQWKKECGVGRRVDLDRLIEWCERRSAGGKGKAPRKAQAATAAPARRSSRSRASAGAAPPTSLLK